MRRVVVTGIGMCTPLGYGVDINWKKLISSQSGIRKLQGFEIDDLNVIKFSFPRNIIQGDIFDRDMHGAQLAVLLSEMKF